MTWKNVRDDVVKMKNAILLSKFKVIVMVWNATTKEAAKFDPAKNTALFHPELALMRAVKDDIDEAMQQSKLWRVVCVNAFYLMFFRYLVTCVLGFNFMVSLVVINLCVIFLFYFVFFIYR